MESNNLYADKELQDFISRFGYDQMESNKVEPLVIDSKGIKKLRSDFNNDDSELKKIFKTENDNSSMLFNTNQVSDIMENKKSSGQENKIGGLAGAYAGGNASNNKSSNGNTGKTVGNIMGGLSNSVGDVMTLVDYGSGKAYETNANSSGPGKAGGHIAKGTMSGASLGSNFGPWGALIGAVVGGGLTAITHSQALQKYYENVSVDNMKKDALLRKKHLEEYNMAQGLVSLENLKALRKKQLGYI